MKVLAINGSHRKGKNTAKMLNMVLEPIKAAGIDTELIELMDYNIKLCKACNKCLIRPECSIKDDDMGIIAQKMLESDAIIIGSPVYFGNVTSKLKIFMDRTRWMHMCENLLEGKLGAIVTHAGLRNGGQEITQWILESYLLHHGLIVVQPRLPKKSIYNVGVMGAMFKALDGEKIKWKKGVEEDLLTVKMCRDLGVNIADKLKNKS
ncbi:flavodoxin family protein [Desulfothermus naphthae]